MPVTSVTSSQGTRTTPTSEKTSPEIGQLAGTRPELPPQGRADSNLSLSAAHRERALSRLDLSCPLLLKPQSGVVVVCS